MKTKQNLALLFNLVSAAFQIYALILVFTARGFSPLQYYTVDSNILACISSVALVLSLLIKGKTPLWVHRLRYYASACIGVTFVVVLVILIPAAGFSTIAYVDKKKEEVIQEVEGMLDQSPLKIELTTDNLFIPCNDSNIPSHKGCSF